MDTNLVRAARVQVGFNESEIADVSQRAPIGASFTSFAAARGHARAAVKIARDGKFDAPGFAVWFAVQQGDILFLDETIAECGGKFGMRGIGASYNDCAGSVFIEPMNDAGTQRAAGGGEPG